MEAKDTVMSLEQLNEIPDWDSLELTPVLEAQAEISFKVGKTAGVAESLQPALKAIEESRKAGIGEVVDWVELHPNVPFYRPKEWEAQKRNWGI